MATTNLQYDATTPEILHYKNDAKIRVTLGGTERHIPVTGILGYCEDNITYTQQIINTLADTAFVNVEDFRSQASAQTGKIITGSDMSFAQHWLSERLEYLYKNNVADTIKRYPEIGEILNDLSDHLSEEKQVLELSGSETLRSGNMSRRGVIKTAIGATAGAALGTLACRDNWKGNNAGAVTKGCLAMVSTDYGVKSYVEEGFISQFVDAIGEKLSEHVGKNLNASLKPERSV